MSPASVMLVGGFYWLCPNHSDLPNSDVGEQVGRVYIKSYLYTKSTQEYRQTKKVLLTLHHE
jgi:hypothetical protein